MELVGLWLLAYTNMYDLTYKCHHTVVYLEHVLKMTWFALVGAGLQKLKYTNSILLVN